MLRNAQKSKVIGLWGYNANLALERDRNTGSFIRMRHLPAQFSLSRSKSSSDSRRRRQHSFILWTRALVAVVVGVCVCGVFHQRREDAYYTTTRAWPWNYDGAHLLPAGSPRGERRGSLPKSCQEIPLSHVCSVQRAKKPPLIKGSRWCAVWLKRLREIFNWLPRRLNPVNFNF